MPKEISGSSAALAAFLCCSAAFATDLPKDVAAFVEERQNCDHFRGEEPYDEARRNEIDRALDRYCRGTDLRLEKLKAKYSKGPAVVREALEGFEDDIE